MNQPIELFLTLDDFLKSSEAKRYGINLEDQIWEYNGECDEIPSPDELRNEVGEGHYLIHF